MVDTQSALQCSISSTQRVCMDGFILVSSSSARYVCLEILRTLLVIVHAVSGGTAAIHFFFWEGGGVLIIILQQQQAVVVVLLIY